MLKARNQRGVAGLNAANRKRTRKNKAMQMVVSGKQRRFGQIEEKGKEFEF